MTETASTPSRQEIIPISSLLLMRCGTWARFVFRRFRYFFVLFLSAVFISRLRWWVTLWQWMRPLLVWYWEGCKCSGCGLHQFLSWPTGSRSQISHTAVSWRWVLCGSAHQLWEWLKFCVYSKLLFPPTGFESDQHGVATVRGVGSPVDSLMHWTVHERIFTKHLCGHHQWEKLFRSGWWILSTWLKKTKQWKPCEYMYLFVYFYKSCLLICK